MRVQITRGRRWCTDWYLTISQLTEDVARKKAEYQKHLDYYKQLRMRFEEHYIKCKT